MTNSLALSNESEPYQEPCVFEFAQRFDQCFSNYNIRLKPGADEPFYQAASTSSPAIIYSNRDFFSSALHEVAHWCIAGFKRRQQNDYGYWYEPDGRSPAHQSEFFEVEIKPQALEWAFHIASQIPFRLSLDNLNQTLDVGEIKKFQRAVFEQLQKYAEQDFSNRAKQVIGLLLNQSDGEFIADYYDDFIHSITNLDCPKELLL